MWVRINIRIRLSNEHIGRVHWRPDLCCVAGKDDRDLRLGIHKVMVQVEVLGFSISESTGEMAANTTRPAEESKPVVASNVGRRILFLMESMSTD